VGGGAEAGGGIRILAMSSLVLLLDEGAPSFCYYPSPDPARTGRMSDEVLAAALRVAAGRELALQVIGGRDGVPAAVREKLEAHEHVCYVSAGSGELRPEDVPVLDADRPESLEALEPGRHSIALLRVPRRALDDWPHVFAKLSSRVERVVLVLLELQQWSDPELERYQHGLGIAADFLLERYLAGSFIELNALSDRLALEQPAECGAGLDHLTVAPDGQLYICPGFALSGDQPVGRVGEEAHIPNDRLLRRSHAPICEKCDAFHCRRCVHLNLAATLEINTPPWQLCRAVHLEREQARVLLGRLHERGLLRGLRPIQTVSYEEPFEALTGHKMRAEPRPAARRFAYLELPVVPRLAAADGQPTKEMTMDTKGKSVGRVTPEERDEIRDLFLRKSALTELFLSLSKLDAGSLQSSPLYDKIIRDMGDVTVKFQSWWENKAKQYGWEGRSGGNWNIDFDTCEIFLQ
jgi:CXXX repeat modification system protein